MKKWYPAIVALLIFCASLGCSLSLAAEIPKPTDAPLPLAPEESQRRFHLPAGFRLELVASEPLVREPSGVCWDESGQLFVCELHGYNLEGQYDIEELNKTGQLDRVVRRLDANEQAKQAAKAGTYGTIKRLRDTNGDGRMDEADIWADRLPTCHGLCPARGGIIAACQSEVLYLADRDGDGRAEVREVLFDGFGEGPLERSVNCPQWGPDNWIYFGRGKSGGEIQGPYLKKPVLLPGTDFRIQPDGSVIEPVTGGTQTMGFAFTAEGDRFVISTRTPGIFIAPIPWKYLARNPDMATPPMEQKATADEHVYPTSQPHPWRTRRFNDPGFSKYYADRYGIQESAPNGYFTSACSPLVYQDSALPGLQGALLACEPAQNLVHRALVKRDGVRLTLGRAPGEEQAEFLASSDSWFHPIAISHAPDGSVFIMDFYREIIEDYSAIPRYLQQEYGLVNGHDHGRIWRLTHEHIIPAPPADMTGLDPKQLAMEVGSPHFWRRETARRLLCERQAVAAVPELANLVRPETGPVTIQNALHTLDGLGALQPRQVEIALAHADPAVRRQGLRFAERWLNAEPALLEKVLSLQTDPEPLVRFQLALSLGECRDARVLPALAGLAPDSANEPWMVTAILSAVPGRGGALLHALLESPAGLGAARSLLQPLCATISARRDPQEISDALQAIAAIRDPAAQLACLQGVQSSIKTSIELPLTAGSQSAVKQLAASSDSQIRTAAKSLVGLLKLETAQERAARISKASRTLEDVQQPLEARLSAISELETESDPAVTSVLLAAIPNSTPQVRTALLSAVFSRRDRLPALIAAIEAKTLPPTALSAVERAALLQNVSPADRARAEALFQSLAVIDAAGIARFSAALKNPRDTAHGSIVFREKCGICHLAHGVGTAVGPDLSAEFQRAEETIIQDILAPSANISAGYSSYLLATSDGRIVTGLIESESASSVTIKQPEGKRQTILRKEIEELKASPVSLMPEDLARTLTPQDVADVIAWLRTPTSRAVLLDDNVSLAEALDHGEGTAVFVSTDRHGGQLALRVTPPQRYSARIHGWSFRIREEPGPGEYRYIRFAWKVAGAQGVMLELADDGAWPPAQQPLRRYYSGRNTTGWQAVQVAVNSPEEWTVVTRDLWKDFGEFTLTGLAPTAMGGPALFDNIDLLRSLPDDGNQGQ